MVHSGRILDFQVQVAFYPDEGFGFYLSTNGPALFDPPALALLTMYISDLLLGEEPWLTAQTACSFPEPWFSKENYSSHQESPYPTDTPATSLEEYIGVYNHPGFGDITVLLDEEGSQLYLYMGQFLEAALYYDAAEDVFHAKLVGRLWFMKERYPVRFEKQQSTDTFDTLFMPMAGPYDEAFPFLNGRAMELRDSEQEENDKNICSQACKYHPSVHFMYFILFCYYFIVLK